MIPFRAGPVPTTCVPSGCLPSPCRQRSNCGNCPSAHTNSRKWEFSRANGAERPSRQRGRAYVVEVKVRKFGNSLGVVLPKRSSPALIPRMARRSIWSRRLRAATSWCLTSRLRSQDDESRGHHGLTRRFVRNCTLAPRSGCGWPMHVFRRRVLNGNLAGDIIVAELLHKQPFVQTTLIARLLA